MADKSAREFAIQSALKDYESGVYSTQSAAARAYNIPQKTFSSRLNGSTNARIGREQQQRLTQEQEEFLVDWILKEDLRGFPPSHTRTREMAARIVGWV
jgi:hypothetical protein